MDVLLTLWQFLIPCSLGNGCDTLGFLIFIIVVRNFLYHSLYILTENSLKHLCSIRAWVPMFFFLPSFLSLSLSLSFSSADSLERRDPSCSLFLPGLLRLSQEGALCLHPPREGTQCLRERCKSCVKDFIGFLRKPGNISLFLSLSYRRLRTSRSGSIKGPQQETTSKMQYRTLQI